MKHAPIEFISKLACFLRPEQIIEPLSERWAYGYDNSRGHQLPLLVLRPDCHEQIESIVAICTEYSIPITARGNGTSTVGAAIPTKNGIVVSFELMNKILAFKPEDRYVVVQPGVTNQDLQNRLAEHGFFWPPDPSSAAYCTIGGNLAFNSAGPRAVKYGTPRENTLGLKVVTGSGQSLHIGTFTTKGVVGYDLTRLIVGSEGTLAIITEATLKISPLPPKRSMLQLVYADVHAAVQAITRIMSQPSLPYALEYIDDQAIDMIRDYSKVEFPANAGALLMVEVDAANDEQLRFALQAVGDAAQGQGLLDMKIPNSETEIEELWKTRKALSPALRTLAPNKINEDVVVPVSRLPELISGLQRLSDKFAIPIVNFGHAGNGNIHVNLLTDNNTDPQRSHECLAEVFALVLDLQGSLSGEHGVGLEKRDYIEQELGREQIALMKRIKQLFDPFSILNPDKGLPS